MSEPVKAAAIVAVAIMIATGLWIYFSPYQTCVRSESSTADAAVRCLAIMNMRR